MSERNEAQQKEKLTRIRRKPGCESVLQPLFAAARHNTSGNLWERDRQETGLLQRQCTCGKHTIAGGECDACRRKHEAHFLQRTFVNPASDLATANDFTEVHTLPEAHFLHNFSQIPLHSVVPTQIQTERRLLATESTHVPWQSRTGGLLQRQERPPSSSPRVGIIPVREFIRHVELVERAYPTKTPQEILTMIRSLYYGSPAGSPGFDRLIPDAPSTGAVEMCTDSEGSRCEEPVGTCVCVYAQGLAMDVGQLRSAISRLRQHADENEIADNPSPYIEVGTNLVDVGHLLVGVDAILHPRTEDPFRSHGLTSAPGPATWEGDVGAGMVYLAEHRASGHKSSDVKGTPSPTVESYYRNSMPMSDLLGDVDAFGMASMVGPQTLSTALRYFYVSESGGSPRYQYNRWAGFCAAVGLTYNQSGSSTITWTPVARQLVIDRITAFANLFQGRTSPVRAMTLGIAPRSWPEAGNFADLFLTDVKAGLEQEMAAHTGP